MSELTIKYFFAHEAFEYKMSYTEKYEGRRTTRTRILCVEV